MSDRFIKTQKAALKSAAFFILIIVISYSFALKALAKTTIENFESIKKKTSEKLNQNQKKEALLIVSEYLKADINKNKANEVLDFLSRIAFSFVSKEAQDAYESSINNTLDNTKESKKQNELCLQIDSQNAACLIQKARLAHRDKNKKEAEAALLELKEMLPKSKTELWLDMTLHKSDAEYNFKNKYILKKFNEEATEDFFVLVVLEIERAILSKNFSRAKEGVSYAEKYFSDWPDIVFFKNIINTAASEDKENKAEVDFANQYISRCKTLTKSVARKFRYDFDLCARGVL